MWGRGTKGSGRGVVCWAAAGARPPCFSVWVYGRGNFWKPPPLPLGARCEARALNRSSRSAARARAQAGAGQGWGARERRRGGAGVRGAGARGGGARREGSAAPRLVRRPRGLLRGAGGGKMAGAAVGGAPPVDPVRLGRCGFRGSCGGWRDGGGPGVRTCGGAGCNLTGCRARCLRPGCGFLELVTKGSLIVNGRLSERTCRTWPGARRNLSFLWEAVVSHGRRIGKVEPVDFFLRLWRCPERPCDSSWGLLLGGPPSAWRCCSRRNRGRGRKAPGGGGVLSRCAFGEFDRSLAAVQDVSDVSGII